MTVQADAIKQVPLLTVFEDRIRSLEPRKAQPRVILQPKVKTLKPEWKFETSIFRPYIRDDQNLLDQCFDFDWKCSNLEKTNDNKQRRTRHDVFVEALVSPHYFFFDAAEDGSFMRTPFNDIDSLLALPEHVFGAPNEWLPFTGLS